MSASEPTVAAVVREQTGLPWSQAKQLCIDGRVTVDGRRCLDPAARVPAGAVVAVDRHGPKVRAVALAGTAVVHCDRDLVVVDKPAGMLSVADEPGNRDTLAHQLRTLLRRMRVPGVDAPLGVVHRLDRDTSGVMVFARTAQAKRALAAQFREHSVERVYLAIAHGLVTAGRLDTLLVPDRGDGLRGSHGRHLATAGPAPEQARRAITHVAPLAALEGATLIECRLETGRQHQIRIHLAEIGHPLVGEQVYMRDYREPKIAAARTMLHALTLGFAHPRTGEPMSFRRDPPDDFQAALAALGRQSGQLPRPDAALR